MSTVNVGKESVADGFHAGHGTVGESETPIYPVSIKITKHIVIRAGDIGDGETITVGRTGQAADGFVLSAGEQTPPIYVDDTDKIAIIGSDSDLPYSWVIN